MSAFDVAIVGGGVIGVSIAFELAAEDLRVVVLDRQQPGQEASWAAAGMLSPAPDSPRDIPLAPLGRESLKLYPRFVGAVEEESGQSASYARDGALEVLLAPRGETDRDRKAAEYRLLELAAEEVSLSAARDREKSFTPDARAALWLPDEASVEPRLLMSALLTAAQNRGVAIRPGCKVTNLLRERNRCLGVLAAGEKIEAAHVVVASGCFSGELAGGDAHLASLLPTRPVRGQMLALRHGSFRLNCVLRSERGYLVPRGDGRIIAGSTKEEAGFEKRVTAAGIRKVLDAAIELCPTLAGAEIVETWSGLRPGTPDDLPIIGPTDIDGLLIATGHYRNGILLTPVTAKLISDWIVHGRTFVKDLDASAFSPLRFADGFRSSRVETA
ncbi:MAG TPA: glycine oxidase ThiO [Candidatus Baltobacteraceae bacterium]|nr:glycine oxidase ThiO [Candidatus Baltobacteraceae bacterium]